MAKKKYKNLLPKAGSTLAVAVAMSVALSTQVNATELDDDGQQNNGNPLKNGQNAGVNQSGTELKEKNEAVENQNGAVVEDNQKDINNNQGIIDENNAALEQNKNIENLPKVPDAPDASKIPAKPDGDDIVVPDAPGALDVPEIPDETAPSPKDAPVMSEELQNPNLPDAPTVPDAPDLPKVPEKPDASELPDVPSVPDASTIPEKPVAPEAPNTDGMSVDEHNAAAGEYNGKVDGYNEDAKEYNDAVDEYNKDVGEFNDGAGKYNDAAEDYNEKAGNYNTAVDNYNTEAGEYNEDAGEYNGDMADYLEKAEDYNEKAEEYNTAAGTYNDAVDSYNTAAKEYNGEVDAYNGKVDSYNAAADAYNSAADQYEQDVKEYNDAIDAYNQKVDEYNAAADAYNTAVGEYNAAAETYNQKVQQDYETEQAAREKEQAMHDAAAEKYTEDAAKLEQDAAADTKYQKDKADYDAACKAYLEARKAYEDSLADGGFDAEKKTAFEDAKIAYQQAHDKYQDDVKSYNESLNSYSTEVDASEDFTAAEFQAYLEEKAADYLAAMETYSSNLAQYQADSAAYEQYLVAKEAYDAAYATYLDALYAYNTGDLAAYKEKVEQAQRENAILQEVKDYNNQVTEYNNQMNAANDALRENIDVGVKEDLEDLGPINDAMNEQADAELQAILAVLGSYDTRKAALDTAAQALEDHSGKNADLGSAEYAAYLEAVEIFNHDVDEFNDWVKNTYNQAVTDYNAKVDTFNNGLTDEEGESSFEQATGTANWYNFADKNFVFKHIDVRYEAAVVKDKYVDDQGNETYSDSTSGYEILGVYYDQAAMEENPNQFGVRYVDTNKDTIDYTMMKDNEHDEFCTDETINYGYGYVTVNRSNANANKDTVVTFYAKLKDSKGEIKYISVEMDKNSVYAENSYFKYDAADALDDIVINGKSLQPVEIGDERYYDVSGLPVFLVSALTCDGYDEDYPPAHGHYYGSYMGGLDLVLNLETMIEIHQSERAQKLGFKGYELEKYKTFRTPTNPEEITTPENDLVKPTLTEMSAPVRTPGAAYDPGELNQQPLEAPKTVATLAEVNKLQRIVEKKVVISYADVEKVTPIKPLEEAKKVETLELVKLDGLVEEVGSVETKDSVNYQMYIGTLGTLDKVDYAKHMDLRTKPVVPPVNPNPNPNPQPNPVMPLNDGGLVTIDDGAVPLADVPKTGDASVVFGAMSAFSGFGLALMQLFGRKKKEEN